MVIIKDYSEPKDIEDQSQNSQLPKHPFRLLITGPSGCGKTILLLNFIYDFVDFDVLYICARNISQSVYRRLQENFTQFDDIEEEDIRETIKKLPKKDKQNILAMFRKFKKETLFCSDFKDIPQVDSLDQTKKHLIIFDDCVMEKNQIPITDLFVRGRHKNASVIYLSQCAFKTPHHIRENCNYFIFFRMAKRKFKDIMEWLDGNLTKNQLEELFHLYTKQPYNFLLLDFEANVPVLRYRIMFEPIPEFFPAE